MPPGGTKKDGSEKLHVAVAGKSRHPTIPNVAVAVGDCAASSGERLAPTLATWEGLGPGLMRGSKGFSERNFTNLSTTSGPSC